MADRLSHYEVLGVAHDATEDQIKSAYRELAKSLHPDKNRFGARIMQQINEAYEILSDPSKKKEYDESKQRTKDHSPKPKNSNDEKENEAKKGREAIEPFLCMICDEIVTKSFWESGCCGRLFCEGCLGSGAQYQINRRVCPNISCQEPILYMNGSDGVTIPQGWAKSGKFIQKQIDSVAPTHFCGRNVFPEDLNKHKNVCPKLNTMCFKCFGSGNVEAEDGSVTKCGSCNGFRFLKGLKWTKCFKCNGGGCRTCKRRGALEGTWTMCFRCEGSGCTYDKRSFQDHECNSCSYARGALRGHWTRCLPCEGKGWNDCSCGGKGVLKGKWTMCFKCDGEGNVTTNRGALNRCDVCEGERILKGFHKEACYKCKGYGCGHCNWDGYLSCNCGVYSCRGHSFINK